ALGAPKPALVHIPTDLLGAIAPDRAGICVNNFQFDNIFDNTAAATDLGFSYTIPFLDGARRTCQWLDARGKIEPWETDPSYDRIIDEWERLCGEMKERLAKGGAA
ncbi:epimerase, partial [bacterium]|nr:epimerase [bacterium]